MRKFNKLYTSIEQSLRLLDLGLDRYTADLYCTVLESGHSKVQLIPEEFEFDGDDVPVWTLGRLLELLNGTITIDISGALINDDIYEDDIFGRRSGDILDSTIDLIEFQIAEDYFNKDYISSISLKVVENLVYYDTAQVFLARSESSEYYLGLLQPNNTYLIAGSISSQKIEDFKKGRVDLLEIFNYEENKFYLSDESIDDCFKSVLIDREKITEDMLPGEGFYLNWKED